MNPTDASIRTAADRPARPTSRPMRVLLVGPNSIHFRRYLDSLSAASIVELRLVTNQMCGGQRNWFSDLSGERVAYSRFALRNPLAMRTSARVIRQHADRLGAELIHAHQVNVYAFAAASAARRSRLPLVLTAYGSDIQTAPAESAVLRYLVRRSLRQASRIISESRSLIDEIERLEPGSGIRTRRIPFPLPRIGGGQAKELLAYSNRWHEPNYRIDRVLHAIARLRAEVGPGLRTVIAGEGSETPALKRLAGELGLEECTEFVGWVDATRNAQYYARASYFLSLPDKDAYSISVQEAMQSGCLPILSDIPCNRELVIHGINGVLLDATGGGLEAVSTIDPELARQLNRGLIERTTSAEVCVPAFLQVYSEALGLPK